jgi:hypothetical protein
LPSNPWKHGEKHAPPPECARDADPPPLGFDDALRECETEAGPLLVLRGAGVELLEFDEQTAQVFRADADAVVLDFKVVQPVFSAIRIPAGRRVRYQAL